MKMQCYCCGDPLDLAKPFALVSLSGSGVDRVFVMKPEHTDRVNDAPAIVIVKVTA